MVNRMDSKFIFDIWEWGLHTSRRIEYRLQRPDMVASLLNGLIILVHAKLGLREDGRTVKVFT